jgi:molecular chaperone GrpE
MFSVIENEETRQEGSAVQENGALPENESGEDMEGLKSMLRESRDEAAQLKEEAARAKADFYNYRTRIERDRAKDRVLAAENAVMELLPVLDNLDRALDAENDKESKMYKGISMVRKQFFAALQNLGLKLIEASGAFDPSMHEAVMTVEAESDEEDGAVVEVLHRGYMLGEKVLQAAKVKVGRKKAQNKKNKEENV